MKQCYKHCISCRSKASASNAPRCIWIFIGSNINNSFDLSTRIQPISPINYRKAQNAQWSSQRLSRNLKVCEENLKMTRGSFVTIGTQLVFAKSLVLSGERANTNSYKNSYPVPSIHQHLV